jgi:glyoxylase-like metal-dependent hydrolase (beta-lactamase superfamily II)
MKKIILSLCLFSSISIAGDFDNVEIKVTKANGNVYMLQGAGGNIGLLATSKGLVMIDDEFAPLAERIDAAMQSIEKKNVKYIINTHFHGDHTGSNTYFGDKAPIVAHQNVRERLADKEPAEQVTLPEITYDNGMTLYFDDEEVQLTHLAHGHTDGDTYVYFKKANVLHTGDLFFELGFPYIDLKHGGSVKGYLADVQYILAHTPDDVVIIPGHGKLTDKKRFAEFANMIAYSIKHVESALKQGKSEREIITEGLGNDYKKWAWQFITEEKWLKTLITDLQPKT